MLTASFGRRMIVCVRLLSQRDNAMEQSISEFTLESTGRILCVDDEPSILSSLKRLLHGQNYEIFTVSSGKEGLAVLENNPIDLVISDMRMPEMNGAQFLEQVFSLWPDTIRILLTGYSDAVDMIGAINRGNIWRFIAKPWNDEELLITVQQGLAHQYLNAENARLNKLTQQQNDELKSINSSLELKIAERTSKLEKTVIDLRHTLFNSVKVFSSLIELRGGKLGGHSKRVADHALLLTKKLALDEKEAQLVYLAALLHDIGKIGLPDELISPPFELLSPEGCTEVMKHSEKGELLLMPVQQLHGVAGLIRSHHEHYDGSGYPDKLSGKRIPIGSRIISVASDYDDFLMGAYFNRAYDTQEAIEYLQMNRGKHYDPEIVDAFVAGLNETGHSESKEIALAPDELVAGMELVRDLMHEDGFLLFTKNQILEQTDIEKLKLIVNVSKQPYIIYIKQVLNSI